MIVTSDDRHHVVAPSPAAMTALVALAQADNHGAPQRLHPSLSQLATRRSVYAGNVPGASEEAHRVKIMNANCAVLRGFRRALFRTRTGDPLLTMRCDRQPVATGGNGFGVIPPFSRLRDLPLLASG